MSSQLITFGVGAVGRTLVRPHEVPAHLADALVARAKELYPEHVYEVSRRRIPRVHLDPGGLVNTKTPIIDVCFLDYTVGCKLDHLPTVFPYLVEKLESRRGVYTLDGVEVLPFKKCHPICVVPVADLPMVIAEFKKQAPRAEATVATIYAELQKSPHVLVVRPPVLEE